LGIRSRYWFLARFLSTAVAISRTDRAAMKWLVKRWWFWLLPLVVAAVLASFTSDAKARITHHTLLIT
jgi:hypothetical protein